jgi:hypothetical protein
MRAVDDEPRLFDPADEVASELAEAAIARLLAAVADPVPHVVGELNHAHAELGIGLDEVEVVLDRIGALEMENQAERPLALRRLDVGGAADEAQIVAPAQHPVPAGQIPQRLGRAGRAADGRRAGGDAAFLVPVDELAPAQQRAGAVDDDRIVVQRRRHHQLPAAPWSSGKNSSFQSEGARSIVPIRCMKRA